MAQEDRDLLLKDLSTRLPYGVKVRTPYNDAILRGIVDRKGVKTTIDYTDIVTDKQTYPIRYIKPYLRPISSMTDEEMNQLFDILRIDKDGNDEDWIKINDVLGIKFFFRTGKWVENVAEAYDYLNSIHIDYRGLIGKGLALEAPEGMYK